MALIDLIHTLIRPEDLALLPEGAADRAIAAALERYSADFPHEKMVDVNASDELLNMPPDWVNGVSRVVQVQHPADGTLTPTVQPTEPSVTPSGDDGVSINFVMENWIAYAGNYHLDLTHGLESFDVSIALWEGNNPVLVDRIERLTTNKIRLWVTSEPDFRFNGTAIIERA